MPPTEPTTFDWITEVAVPGVLGLGTLAISIVSLWIARAAQSISRDAERRAADSEAREADRRARDELMDLLDAVLSWSSTRFAIDPVPLEEKPRSSAELARIITRLSISPQPRSAEVVRVLRMCDAKLTAASDLGPVGYTRASGACGGLIAETLGLWVAGRADHLDDLPALERIIDGAIAAGGRTRDDFNAKVAGAIDEYMSSKERREAE